MSEAEMELKGFDELRAAVDYIVGCNVTAEVKEKLKEAAEECFEGSQELCPVDKGLLKASGRIEEVEDGFIIWYGSETDTYGEGAYYCNFVEFGTRLMAPNPFLGPAFYAATESLFNKLREAFG